MTPPSKKPLSARPRRARPPLGLPSHEQELSDFFVRMAGILGVPRSVAQIYALLYGADHPLDFDQVQARLKMSKGSVSQGLKFLRDHEMILSVKAKGARRERWQPTPSLAASLVNLIRSQVLPALQHSTPVLQRVLEGAEVTGSSPEVIERLSRLKRWNTRALELFPLMLPPPKGS
jgi:DNA-binding transcriptional regulator GbsR (MarR family)